MILPAPSLQNILLYLLFTLMAVGMGVSEWLGLMTMRYSKFRPEKGISSRLGMFLLYFVPLLGVLFFSLPYLAHPTLVQLLVVLAVGVHFLKRCLEVLFLHKYSGPIDVFSAVSIGMYYSLNASVISALNASPLARADGWVWLGLLFFTTGLAGNFLHHKILADLRMHTSEYFLPRGGLFDYVVCPHYLFELLTWLGIALLSRHLFAWLVLMGMTGYLLARSLNTLKWYRQKFPALPEERKALIPFVL